MSDKSGIGGPSRWSPLPPQPPPKPTVPPPDTGLNPPPPVPPKPAVLPPDVDLNPPPRVPQWVLLGLPPPPTEPPPPLPQWMLLGLPPPPTEPPPDLPNILQNVTQNTGSPMLHCGQPSQPPLPPLPNIPPWQPPPPPPDVTQSFGTNITVVGSPTFVEYTLATLTLIRGLRSGAKIFNDLEDTTKKVTIIQTHGGNGCTAKDAAAAQCNLATNRLGPGSDSIVEFNFRKVHSGVNPRLATEKWMWRPPGVSLAHELIHAVHNAHGDDTGGAMCDNDSQPDPARPWPDPKVPGPYFAQTPREEARTVGLPGFETEPYSENKIRAEWNPPQPIRTYY